MADSDDGYDPDSKVAKFLGKHVKTIKRWDKNKRLKELGWPDPLYLNGRSHRHRPAVQAFLRNAAAAAPQDLTSENGGHPKIE